MNIILKKIVLVIVSLFIMALGVALSIKADLGVTPISCIPYVYSLKFDLTVGEITILMNTLFVIAQFILLRKNFTFFHFSQLLLVTIFGFCIDFALFLVSSINPTMYIEQFALCIVSCAVLAFGIFLLVKANVTYLPGDGFAVVITDKFKKEFGKVKVCVDSSMVAIGIVSSLTLLGSLQGVREGTIIAALLIGSLIRFYGSKIHFLDRWVGNNVAEEEKMNLVNGSNYLAITIAREYGSGGHKIGQEIATKLGIDFYDKELIDITAEKSGFTQEYIQENEQKLSESLLDDLYMQNYAYVKDELPPSDVLFLVQSKIIREISQKGPCVIVGRCADFILKNNPNCFRIFIHANTEFRKSKIVNEYGVASNISNKEMEKLDRERANYCLKYTGSNWKDSTNYDVTIDSSNYTTEQVADMLIDVIQTSMDKGKEKQKKNASGGSKNFLKKAS